MESFRTCLFVIVIVQVSLVLGHGDHEGSRLHNTKVTHDKEHIKEHLKEENIDVKDENLKDEDLQFHYFKMHDYDGNSKLDGIELMNAMTHYHDESDTNSTETYTDEQMSTMIDQILNEDDTNKDGYIDYPEFIASQKS
ncbi:multiple coagulation factor deficiency protein 2 homolog [Exaiptasia diaphana]|uniref:EF-hand domain-containing protein n=1 Tax=Exaiptasia diaphana TaxID=2652724 RepID=A0A913WVY0_EXADI|nr:multiple coagulation factor deficiency protein 2 homolog [Exaiptasia diaphana]KXJ17515.1 Multiple coagulation factor deficiency protein 2-like [Exaiptasia diaphana]